MVAGINIAIFKDSKNLTAAEKFVKFMTSTPTQESLNHTYGSLPTVQAAYSDPAFNTPACTPSAPSCPRPPRPCPRWPRRASSRPRSAPAIIHLYASAATGKTVTDSMIGQALSQAQQQLGG